MTTTSQGAPSAQELADAHLEDAAADRRIPHSLLCDLDFIEYQDYAMDRGHGCVRDEGLRGCECEKAFAKAAK